MPNPTARKLEWRHVPDPVISGPKAALVRPVAVGVCDFDRGLVSGRYAALPYPIPLGHEVVAEVIAVGCEVRDIQPGMQVVLPLHISCGSCASCNLGHTNSCTSRSPLSNYGLGRAWRGLGRRHVGYQARSLCGRHGCSSASRSHCCRLCRHRLQSGGHVSNDRAACRQISGSTGSDRWWARAQHGALRNCDGARTWRREDRLSRR
ncbi:alcohol dehydrogenase catalytic domain-containing protein [Bradyrhizobium sp.]|uniref:alcohol dehydrogenase catalytic domain-containing protein n=1 Tax=Bradyrhizobium sp. TaxID=376 RepID=UPI003BAF98AE